MSSARSDHSTVVCVDDDEMVVDLMAALVPRTGAIDVEGFTDAERALSRIASGGVDCVVSDYEMPNLDGFDLLERVRTTDPDLPFILYTANGSEGFASDAVARGVTEFVRKDTGSDQFALLGRRIEEAVARYRSDRRTDDRFRSRPPERPSVSSARTVPSSTPTGPTSTCSATGRTNCSTGSGGSSSPP